MKKEILIHFLSAIVFFALLSLVRNWLNINYLPLWIGALLGTILPDVDHLIYIYYLKPYELTSQRAIYGVQKGRLWETLNLLASTRQERKELIFHQNYFQIIFVVFAFLILTSSSSLIGRGIVLGFLVHLVVDQFVDLMKLGNIDNWFTKFNFHLDKQQQTFYFIGNLLVVLVMGVLL